MVTLDGISRQFLNQTMALDKVSLHIPVGEVVGIIGASGAGKTTLIKIICGLLMPTAGDVRVMELDPLVQRKRIGRYIGVLFAEHGMLRAFDTVNANLEMVKNVYRRNDTSFMGETEELCDRFGIQGYRRTIVKELSFGQRRRVELVCLLLQRSKILVFDEPCNGLDADGKKQFEEEILRRSKMGITILISSHNMGEIEGVCTRIMLMEQGRVLFYGDRRRLLRRFAPMDVLIIRYDQGIPDLQDLPIRQYVIDNQTITISYNSNYITAAEIVHVLLGSINIKEMSVKKPRLEEVIAASIRKGEK